LKRSLDLAMAGPLAVYTALVARFWFVCDDAFITFRYSRNWALGNGIRYNLGDHTPVEGYSNFLWMTIAAGLEAVGASPAVWMPWLSFLCGLALVASVYVTVKELTSAKVALAAAFFVSCMPNMAVWATSGLATTPFALALFWTARSLWMDDKPIRAGLSALAMALLRTEGVAWAVVLLGLDLGVRLLKGDLKLKAIGQFAASFGVPFAIYFAWRSNYFDAWVANTASAKVHMSGATLMRGLSYVGNYMATLVAPIAILVAAPLTLRKGPVAMAFGAMCVGIPAYAVAISGDYMSYFRVLMPGVPFLAVAAALAFDRYAAPLLVVMGLVAIPSAFDAHLVPQRVRASLDVREKAGRFRSEYVHWQSMDTHASSWTARGLALKKHFPEDTRIVLAAIGATGYYSDLFVYDRNGLVDREVAAQPFSGKLRSPGHDKVVPASFFRDEQPELMGARTVRLRSVTAMKQIRGVAASMDAPRLKQAYVPDAYPVGEIDGVDYSGLWLVVVRRLAEGEDRDEALKALEERVSTMGAGQ